MREKTAIAEVQKQLRMRSPSRLGEQTDTMESVACCRFAEDDDPLEIDCVVPLSTISAIQPDLALYNLCRRQLGTQKLIFYVAVGSITTSHFGNILDRLNLFKYFFNFFLVRETPVSYIFSTK